MVRWGSVWNWSDRGQRGMGHCVWGGNCHSTGMKGFRELRMEWE